MPAVNYDWDDVEDNIVEEYDDAGVTVAEYTTEPNLYGNVISQNRSGVESQFHFDALGSTLAVTGDNQNVTDTRAYSAFGETTESAGGTVFRPQYVGEKGYHKVAINGDISIRRRPLRPQLARWLSADPMAHARPSITFFVTIGKNAYRYAHCNPVLRDDPSGQRPRELHYASCCKWCQICKTTLLTQACHLFYWAPAPYEYCVGPQTVACKLPLGADGKPIFINGRLYLEPRQCCESTEDKPWNVAPNKCFPFEAKSFDASGCSTNPWPSQCDGLLVDWISRANQGPGSEGHALCIEWCNMCVIPDANIVVKGIVTRLCYERICAPSFPAVDPTSE